MTINVITIISTLLIDRLIKPHNPNTLKKSPYKYNKKPIRSTWSNFNIRFYIISLIFIIFNIKNTLIFPITTIFRRFNKIKKNRVLLKSLLLFILILVLKIIYYQKKNNLN